MEACKLAGLNVPEDVAVVGVDNDEVFCELADPPLSSVALNAETAGYRAAALLEAMMQGRVQKASRSWSKHWACHAPLDGIVAVDDEDIANALQFIRQQHGCDISVDRVAEEVAMSRRSLEKRFREPSAERSSKRSSSRVSSGPSACCWRQRIPFRRWLRSRASARPATSFSSFRNKSAKHRAKYRVELTT